MKKILLTIMIVTVTLVLTACSSGKKEPYIGLWNYKMSNIDYSVELLENNNYVMKQGDAERKGTYTVREEDKTLYITLEYNKTYGYMKYENDKMCALTTANGDCDFYFER